MSKTKSDSKATKPTKSDVLSKVKNAGVTKPAKDAKSKTEITKKVIEKEEKKSKKDKKKAKEPTPEPSSEEDAASSESESSESESEVEDVKSKTNGKANGVKKGAVKDDDSSESDSESDSEVSESSEDEEPQPKKANDKKVTAPKANGVKVSTKAAESSDESESSDEEQVVPNAVLGKAPTVVEAAAESSEESESSDDEEDNKPKTKAGDVKAGTSDSSEEEDGDDDSSQSGSESEEEETKPATKINKRKAEEATDSLPKKAKTDAAVDESKKTLFVGNLSWNVDDAWLRETFEEHGTVIGVRVQYDKATGKARGYAYVDFGSAEDAAAAHEAKAGFELDGRAMNLDFANSKPDDGARQENRRKSYGDQLSDPTDTLFVGNLSFDVGQEQVSEAFSPYGTIMGVRLPTDPDTGALRGFGHVTFASVEDAQAALEGMQGGYISNRPVRLDYSSPRPPRENSGFGGGRGRGGDRGRGGFGGRGRGGDRGRGGRGNSFGGRGRGGDRGGRGGRGGSTNRGGFGDFRGQKQTFD